MNNLHLQKFQFFRFTEGEPNNDIYGTDVWDTEKIFLALTTGEIYSQYLKLKLDNFETFQNTEIISLDGYNLIKDKDFFITIKSEDDNIIIIFGFKKTLKTDCKTLFFKITTSKGRIIYSNLFNISTSKYIQERTSIVTYWHSENFYNADYEKFNYIPQQIRLPLYFSHTYSEGEAEEYHNSYQLENSYRSGKVKRLFMESWKVILNDSNYSALCTSLDSDNVYFNNYFFSIKPFVPERDKDEKGFTISDIEVQRDPSRIFDPGVFGQWLNIYADEITYNFEYENEPVNVIGSGQHFLVNRLYNNYVNDFGIEYDCNLKFKITKVPVKGFLANNITGKIYNVGDIENYCNKDNLNYYPNGFDNNLGIMGDFSETFMYRIIDQNGNEGIEITHTINMVDIKNPEIILSAEITWADGTTAPITGKMDRWVVNHVGTTENPLDPVVLKEWDSRSDIYDFIWMSDPYYGATTDVFFGVGVNETRLKLTTQSGIVFYSNILQYTKQNSNVIVYDREKYIYIERVLYVSVHWAFPMPDFFIIPEDGDYKFDFIITKTQSVINPPPTIFKMGKNRNGQNMDTFTNYTQIGDAITTPNGVINTSFVKYFSKDDVLDLYYQHHNSQWIRLGINILCKITKL